MTLTKPAAQAGHLPRPFLTAAEVAGEIGLPDGASFLRRRTRLETDDLFPLPLRSSLRPMLWRRDEIAAWVARNGLPCAEPIPADAIASGKVVLLAMARTA